MLCYNSIGDDMKKKLGIYALFLLGIFYLFMNVDAAEMITYMGCGDQKGISYDLPGFIRAVILVIQIGVPILLILIGSIDLVKVVIGNDKDDLGKALAKLGKRSVFAMMVFFSIFFVKLLLSLLGKNSDSFMACISCFTSDGSKCYTYEVEKVDNSDEKNASKADRDELEAKREEARKENEKEAAKNKEESDKQHGGNNSGSNSDSTGISGTKTIYVGDSRTVQLCATLTNDWVNCQFKNKGSAYVYKNNEFFVAQGSMGYNWLVDTAVPEVNRLLKNDPGTTYNIVSFMGVNGLGADSYVTKYKELANGAWKGHNIVLVSVNPVKGSYSHMTSGIESFNSKIKSAASSISNASYCDTYSQLKGSFGSSDGLHYDSATYNKIYSLTKTCITNSSKVS